MGVVESRRITMMYVCSETLRARLAPIREAVVALLLQCITPSNKNTESPPSNSLRTAGK